MPPPAPWPQDSGQPFSAVVQNHLAVLEANPALRAAFLANPNWLNINGLPMAPIATYGNVAVLRAQRAVYQQWLQAMPWAAAGQVTVANGGDVAKTLGLWPTWAVAPLSAQQAPRSAMTGPLGPQPTATPNPQICAGDEQITFPPPNPVPGQQVTIQVTSALPAANANLAGPNYPQLLGSSASGRGTVWTWTVFAGQPGSYEYDFYRGSIPCQRGFLTVGGAPAPTPTPTACNGDEALTFTPPNPNVGQVVSIQVTSARPSTNVGLVGPFNPSFQGAGPGGRGTIWTWTVVPGEAGAFSYTFTINGVPCASGTLGVSQPVVPTNTPVPPPPPPQACTGQERMSFFPNPAVIGQRVTVNVSNAARGITPSLSGPFNPVYEGAGPGGTAYSWTLVPSTGGEGITYRYVVNGIPCTTGFLTVHAPPPGLLTPTPRAREVEPPRPGEPPRTPGIDR